jgi:hypothetical protein
MSESDVRALTLRLIALIEPLAVLPAKIEQIEAEVATLKGYSIEASGTIELFSNRLGDYGRELAAVRAALEHQGNGLFAISKDLQDLRTAVLKAEPANVPIEHERINRLSERAR